MNILKQWEECLAREVARVVLLGEIPITEDQAQVLAKNVRRLVEHAGKWTQAFNILKEYYPNCLAVTLVTQAIFAYQDGDYWSQVQDAIGLADIQTHQQGLGQFFEGFLKARGLPHFPSLAKTGYRYVTPILMHAGIPNSVLPDYFSYFVRPMLREHGALEHRAEELIDAWLNQKHYAIPKPLQRFLKYSGKVAIDFVARSLEYAESRINGEERGELINVPLRVQECFDAWFTAHPWQLSPRIARHRLTAPTLRADPWGIGPLIEFPEQHLPPETNSTACEWTIFADTDERKLAIAAHQIGQTRHTPKTTALLTPAERYQVTFISNGHSNQAWEFEGITPKRPLLAFDPDTNALIRWRSLLPRRVLNILVPPEATLEVKGGNRREQFPGFGGAWLGYRFEQWNLTDAVEVRIDGVTIPVEHDAGLHPTLTGEQNTAILSDDLVFMAPPNVVIPVSPSRTPEDEASLWQARLIRMHEEIWSGSLSKQGYVVQEDALHFSLANLLASDMYGSFVLALRGPLGRDITQRFIILPSLKIVDRHPLRYPDDQGNMPPGDFTLMLDTAFELLSGDPQIDIITTEQGSYRVKIPSALTQASLILRACNNKQEIPVTVLLPQVQWTYIDDIHKFQIYDWQAHPLPLDSDKLQHAVAPAVMITTTGAQMPINPYITFAYHPDAPAQELQPQRYNPQQWVFHLGALKDTLRYAASGTARLYVQFGDAAFFVARISQDAGISLQEIDNCLVDDIWLIHAQWDEKRHLQNRQLLLWSFERPWEAPHALVVPNDSGATCDWEIPAEQLLAGRYRAQLSIRDPWSARLPQMPSPSPSVRDIQLGTSGEHRQRITSLECTTLGMLERIAGGNADAEIWEKFCEEFDPIFIEPASRTLGLLQARLHELGGRNATLQRTISLLQRVLRRYPTEHVRLFLGILEPMERQIVVMHYGINEEEAGTSLPTCTPAEISKQIGLSAQRIQQIIHHSLEKMRSHARQLGHGDLLQNIAYPSRPMAEARAPKRGDTSTTAPAPMTRTAFSTYSPTHV